MLLQSNSEFLILHSELKYYVANLCPVVGGKAVYRARAIIRLFNDSIVYNDDYSCSQSLSLRKSKSVLDDEVLKVKLIGNPVTSNSIFLFNNSTKAEMELRIYDEVNHLLFIRKVPANTVNYSLASLTYLQNGIYFYEIINNEQVTGKGKMIVLK